MTSDNVHDISLARRLKDLEHFTGSLARRSAVSEVAAEREASTMRVPEPRRSRVFLRNGTGHGVFAELTLTAPRPRSARD